MNEGRKERQPACKPGSVWPGFCPDVTAIPLGRPSPGASSNQPERQGQRMRPRPRPRARAHRSYSVLLPAGLAVPPTLPPARCALAAPFHPYPCARPCGRMDGRFAFCGAFPGVAPAGRYPAPHPFGARTFLRFEAAAVRPTGETGIWAQWRGGQGEKSGRLSDWGCGARRGRRSLQLHPEYGIVPPEQATGLRALRPVAFLGGEQL